MKITPKFDFGQKVMVKADHHRGLNFVVSYTVMRGGEILYNLSNDQGVATYYDFELDDYENRLNYNN